MTLFERFKQFTAPPVFDDDDEARTARLLTIVLAAFSLLTAALVPVTIALDVSTARPRLGLGALMLATMAGLYFLMRSGRVWLAAKLLPAALLIVATISVYLFGGLSSPFVGAYFIVIAVAGLLISGRWAMVFAALSILTVWGLYLAEVRGWLTPYTAAQGPRAAVLYGGLLTIMAVILGLAARTLREYLTRTRQLSAQATDRALLLDEHLAAAQQRARQLRLLAYVTRDLAGLVDSQALMDETALRLREDFGYEHVQIYLVEEGDLVLRARSGPEAVLPPLGERIPLGAGIIGRVAQSGEVVLASDTSAVEYFIPLPGVQIESEVAVPLRLGHVTIGVLNIESERPAAFAPDDVDVLKLLADLLAASLHASGLLAQTRRTAEQLALLNDITRTAFNAADLPQTFQHLADRLARLIGADGCAITQWDETEQTVIPVAVVGQAHGQVQAFHVAPGEVSLTQSVLRTGRVLVAEDLLHTPYLSPRLAASFPFRSILGLPLMAGEHRLGVALLGFVRPHAFTPQELSVAGQAVDQMALVLAQVRALEMEQKRRAELEVLRQAHLHLTSRLEFKSVLQAILEQALKIAAAMDAHIFLYDGQELAFGAALWADGSQREPYSKPRENGLTYSVARGGEAIVVPDVDSHPLYENEGWGGAIVGLPLTVGGKVRGVMNVAYERPHQVDAGELRVLQLLADQAAIILEQARLFEAEHEQRELAEALREAGRALSASLDFETVLDSLLDQVARVVPYDAANIMLVEDDRVRIARQRGYEQFGAELTRDVGALLLKVADTPNLRRMSETGSPLAVSDTAADPQWINVGASPYCGSWVGAPILVHGRAIAFFSLDKIKAGFYRPEHAERLAAFAGHASLALQNARLFESTRRQVQELTVLHAVAMAAVEAVSEDELIERATQLMGRTLYPDSFGVLLMDELAGGLRPHASYRGVSPENRDRFIPLRTGITGQVASRGRPLRIPDVSQAPDYLDVNPPTRSELCVPLKVGDRIIGVINAESSRLAAFSETDERLLTTLAGQLAIAIQNLRLFAAMTDHLSREQRLNDVARTISGTLDLSTILPYIVRLAAELIGAEAGALGLVEPDGNTITYPHLYNLPEALSLEPAAKGQGVAWRIVQRGKSVLLTDYSAHPNALPSWVELGVQAFLGVPVVAGDTRLGALGLFSFNAAKRFTERDMSLVETIGQQAGVAIQNARLFEAEQRRAEERRQLLDAARDFSAGLSEDAVLHAIVRHNLSVLNATGCTISRWEPAEDHVRTLLDFRRTPTPHIGETPGVVYPLAAYPATRYVLESRQPLQSRTDDPAADAAERWMLAEFGYGAALMLPLVAGDQVFGLLEVARDAGMPPFSESEIQLGQSLAVQAAAALENARLHATVKEHVRELDALLTANTALLSTLELDPLLHNILTAAIDAIPAAEKGTVLMVDRPAQKLQIRAVVGYSDERVQLFSFSNEEGYSAKAMREHRPLLIADARADPEIRYDGDIQEVLEVQSAVVAPLMLHEHDLYTAMVPLGVISLDATRRNAFAEADLRLLVAFANTAAVAIDHARLHSEVQTLAVTDSLTGLSNHRAFERALRVEVARANRYGHTLALVFMDIDAFKLYNDTYGHPAGNERLKAIAEILRGRVRDPDMAARYGGEEFALLLPHTNKLGALALAERIRAAAEASAPSELANGGPISGYTLSLGVAVLPHDATTPEALLLAADTAELVAKRAGKNRVCAAAADLPAAADT